MRKWIKGRREAMGYMSSKAVLSVELTSQSAKQDIAKMWEKYGAKKHLRQQLVQILKWS